MIGFCLITISALSSSCTQDNIDCSDLNITLYIGNVIDFKFQQIAQFHDIKCNQSNCHYKECCEVKEVFYQQTQGQGQSCGAISIILAALELKSNEELMNLDFAPAEIEEKWHGEEATNQFQANLQEKVMQMHEVCALWGKTLSLRPYQKQFQDMDPNQRSEFRKKSFPQFALPYRLNRAAKQNGLTLDRFIVPSGRRGTLWKWSYLLFNSLLNFFTTTKELNFLRSKACFTDDPDLKEGERMICLCVLKPKVKKSFAENLDMHWIVKRPNNSIHNSTGGNERCEDFDKNSIWENTGVGMVYKVQTRKE